MPSDIEIVIDYKEIWIINKETLDALKKLISAEGERKPDRENKEHDGEEVVIRHLTCQKCGVSWWPQKPRPYVPKVCAYCNQRKWEAKPPDEANPDPG